MKAWSKYNAMKKAQHPFLKDYYERTEVASKQIRQKLDALIGYRPFKRETELRRRLLKIPAALTPRGDRYFPPGFLENFPGGIDGFFAQPAAEVVPPLASKWFLSRPTKDRDRVRENTRELLRRFKLPDVDGYYYWMFDYLLYGMKSGYPRSNVDFVNLKLPHLEALNTQEKRLLRGNLKRIKKEDPAELIGREEEIKKKLAERRGVRERKSQKLAFNLEKSGQRPSDFAWDMLGEKNESTVNMKKVRNTSRQAKIRLDKRRKKEFGGGR